MEGIVGTAVFVRCFVDRHRIGEQVMDKLGNGFTRAPFAAVVVRSSFKLGLITYTICIQIVEYFSVVVFLVFFWGCVAFKNLWPLSALYFLLILITL